MKMSSNGAQTVAVAPKCDTATGDAKKCNTDQNTVPGVVAPQKQPHVEGAQPGGGVRAESSACKCAPNCNCNPCNCK